MFYERVLIEIRERGSVSTEDYADGAWGELDDSSRRETRIRGRAPRFRQRDLHERALRRQTNRRPWF